MIRVCILVWQQRLPWSLSRYAGRMAKRRHLRNFPADQLYTIVEGQGVQQKTALP